VTATRVMMNPEMVRTSGTGLYGCATTMRTFVQAHLKVVEESTAQFSGQTADAYRAAQRQLAKSWEMLILLLEELVDLSNETAKKTDALDQERVGPLTIPKAKGAP